MANYQIKPDRDRPNGWRAFSLFGIPVYIEAGFFLLIAFYFISDAARGSINIPEVGLWSFVVFFSILAHEMGHALTARLCGCGQIRVSLVMLGGLAHHSPTTRGRSILICLAGPLFGLTLGVLAYAFYREPILSIGPEGAMSQVLAMLILVNIFWTFFNLLPMYPLDGGQTLFHALTYWLDPRRALVWTARVSMLAAAVAGTIAYQKDITFVALLCGFSFLTNLQMSGILR